MAQSWLDNARTSIDLSSRPVYSQGAAWSQHAVGFDFHTVVTGNNGDIGTLVFQPYVVRIDGAPRVPGLFDDAHDEALQWRIANFNYTGLGHGRFNARVGHFELPFGLEQVIQTNGTLNQLNPGPTTGLKADWGVSLNGELPALEYEFGFMRGGGNEVRTDANGYFVGRVGLPRNRALWLGISALSGEMESGPGYVERTRAGIDGGVNLSRGVRLMAEIAVGDDDGTRGRHFLGEAAYVSPREYVMTYLQWRQSNYERSSPKPDARGAALGLRFEPNLHWSTSVEYRYEFDVNQHPGAVMVQLRYRT